MTHHRDEDNVKQVMDEDAQPHFVNVPVAMALSLVPSLNLPLSGFHFVARLAVHEAVDSYTQVDTGQHLYAVFRWDMENIMGHVVCKRELHSAHRECKETGNEHGLDETIRDEMRTCKFISPIWTSERRH